MSRHSDAAWPTFSRSASIESAFSSFLILIISILYLGSMASLKQME